MTAPLSSDRSANAEFFHIDYILRVCYNNNILKGDACAANAL